MDLRQVGLWSVAAICCGEYSGRLKVSDGLNVGLPDIPDFWLAGTRQ
ncbi:hypothetical protein [Neisseria sp. S1]